MSAVRPNWQALAALVTGLISLAGLPFTATMGTGASLLVTAIVLDFQIAFEHLFNVFADVQLAQILQIRNTFQEQNTLDDLVSVLHLFDGLIVFPFGEGF